MKNSADFIIIGAGYAGLMAALTLSRAGKSVMVIDAQPIGGNSDPNPGHTQSAISGGHVVIGFSQDFDEIQKRYGEDYARQLFQLSVDGIDTVENLCQEMGGAGFRRGYLVLARNERDDDGIRYSIEEKKKFGISADKISLLTPIETKSFINSPDFQRSSLYSKISGQIEPYEYVIGLARLAEQADVKFMPSTRIADIALSKNETTLTTDRGQVLSAPKVIISGGTGILKSGFFPEMRKYQAVIGNYALKTEILSEELIKQIFPSGYKGAFCDMRHTDVLYARLDHKNRLDFGAYSFSGTRPNSEEVQQLLYATFPQLKDAGVGISEGRYGFLSGTKLETMQMFQVLDNGVMSVNSFKETGPLTILSAFGGAGINLGTMSGLAVAEAYLGHPEKLNLLARIKHPKLPITFPWERANRLRDYNLTKALSLIDRGSSKNGLMGCVMRFMSKLI